MGSRQPEEGQPGEGYEGQRGHEAGGGPPPVEGGQGDQEHARPELEGRREADRTCGYPTSVATRPPPRQRDEQEQNWVDLTQNHVLSHGSAQRPAGGDRQQSPAIAAQASHQEKAGSDETQPVGDEPGHPRLRIGQPGDRQNDQGCQRRVVETLELVRRAASQKMDRGGVVVAEVGVVAIEDAQRQPQAAVEKDAGQPGGQGREGPPAACPWSHESPYRHTGPSL